MSESTKTYLRYLPAKAKIKNRQMIGEAVAIEAVRRTIFHERFAVTTEFEVGDEVQTIDGDKAIVDEVKTAKTFYGKDGSKYNSEVFFKILAPISLAVSWEIEDGAEIEIELGYDKWEGFKLKERKDGLEPVTCKVKGPCGHYH